MKNSIKVFASASVGNVACGFDVFGFAVEEPGDEVVMRLANEPGVAISKVTGDDGRLPNSSAKNTAGVSVKAFLDHIGSKKGIEIELHKKMPLGSGLGSSAASAVAAVFAANELLGHPLGRKELLPFAMEGERIACGDAHADNVAPSLLGGFVLIRSYSPLDIVKISTPQDLFCTIVHPHIEIRTEEARKILPKNIPMKDAIQQWANTAGLVTGMLQSDFDLIGRSLQDVVVEPVRAKLIPGFYSVKKAALDAGALGCSISGSGPSMFALSKNGETAEKIGLAMQGAFAQEKIESTIYVSRINEEGPRDLSRNS